MEYHSLYAQLQQNHRATDDMSFKPLGVVPLTTLPSFAGVFLKEETINWSPLYHLFGALGAILVWGIFRWELRNIQKCMLYCELIDEMEAKMDEHSSKNAVRWLEVQEKVVLLLL